MLFLFYGDGPVITTMKNQARHVIVGEVEDMHHQQLTCWQKRLATPSISTDDLFMHKSHILYLHGSCDGYVGGFLGWVHALVVV